eukprot:9487441-Pyramimonas_sp.AAC.2
MDYQKVTTYTDRFVPLALTDDAPVRPPPMAPLVVPRVTAELLEASRYIGPLGDLQQTPWVDTAWTFSRPGGAIRDAFVMCWWYSHRVYVCTGKIHRLAPALLRFELDWPPNPTRLIDLVVAHLPGDGARKQVNIWGYDLEWVSLLEAKCGEAKEHATKPRSRTKQLGQQEEEAEDVDPFVRLLEEMMEETGEYDDGPDDGNGDDVTGHPEDEELNEDGDLPPDEPIVPHEPPTDDPGPHAAPHGDEPPDIDEPPMGGPDDASDGGDPVYGPPTPDGDMCPERLLLLTRRGAAAVENALSMAVSRSDKPIVKGTVSLVEDAEGNIFLVMWVDPVTRKGLPVTLDHNNRVKFIVGHYGDGPAPPNRVAMRDFHNCRIILGDTGVLVEKARGKNRFQVEDWLLTLMAYHRTRHYQGPFDPSDRYICCACDDATIPDVLLRCTSCLCMWHCSCAERILHNCTELPFLCPGCRHV